MLPILQIAAKFRPTASAPAGRERPLANFIRTAITRASAELCRRMVRHSGQGDMVSGEVGESRFGARREPETLCPDLSGRAFRFDRRPGRARQIPLKPPRQEPIGSSRPRIYSANAY